MAKLRVFQTIDNKEYIFDFKIDHDTLSSTDKELMIKYGEPEVNFGGEIKADDNVTVLMTLPTKMVKVVSGLPHREIADISVAPWNTDTTNKLTSYRKRLQERFAAAFVALRANSDTFTGEQVTII